MNHGYVDVRLVKVLVVGPAGVGKTSLLHLLLDKDPPEARSSTGCAEQAIRVVRIENNSGTWSEISTKEFKEMIAEAVPVLYQWLQAKGKDIDKLRLCLPSLRTRSRRVWTMRAESGEVREGVRRGKIECQGSS